MAKYRIVKVTKYIVDKNGTQIDEFIRYNVEKRFLFVFWSLIGRETTMRDAEYRINTLQYKTLVKQEILTNYE